MLNNYRFGRHITFDEYERMRNSTDWRWPVVVGNPTCPVLNRIHPLQQHNAEFIYKCAKQWNVDAKIALFGSSVRHDCYPWSDLDVYVDGTFDEYGLMSSDIEDYVDCDIDWVFSKYVKVSDELMSSVNKGVVLYER
ncbi:MAG: nucleotidyltransferase domain-containing protein [Lachnospiraceae bacterium]|nr:nucleotidyltransferase domain-containing protein [Lachnospiraceae bacterium]MCM1235618.1 nucleotidyltransferase domain-containing protein [Ruminococcus flavefaciens]